VDTPFLYIFRPSVAVYNVDDGNNGIGTDTLMGGDCGGTVEGRWFDSR